MHSAYTHTHSCAFVLAGMYISSHDPSVRTLGALMILHPPHQLSAMLNLKTHFLKGLKSSMVPIITDRL